MTEKSNVVRLVTPRDETNQQAIALLERCLKEAREGRIIEVAVSMVRRDLSTEDEATSSNNSVLLLGAIYRTAHRMNKRLDEVSILVPPSNA
jgi:hypothetical protein